MLLDTYAYSLTEFPLLPSWKEGDSFFEIRRMSFFSDLFVV